MKQGKFLPGILIIGAILIAMLAYYGFAGILSVTLRGPANNTWVSNGSWLSTGVLLQGHPNLVNVSFNCTVLTEAGETLLNVSLHLAAARSEVLTFNSTNQTAASNNTGNWINVSQLAQGEYWWTCRAENYSAGNFSWASNNYTLWVDWTKPHTINLTGVTDALNTTVTTLNFSWTAMDNLATSFYCNFSLDGVVNNTALAGNLSGIQVANDTLENWAIQNMPDGNHEWYVSCWDPTNMSSNKNTSETRRFTVDAVGPENIAMDISNDSWMNSAAVNFSWTATNAGTSVLDCNLTVDRVINKTLRVASGTKANFTVEGLSNGMHTWYVNCSNYFATWNASSAPIMSALWVDTAKPHTINLSGVSDGFNTTATKLNFSWTAMDNYYPNTVAPTLYCNFTLDGVVNNTGIAGNLSGILVANDTLEYWSVVGISNGNHEWYVSCWDLTNATSNKNTSETRRFTVDNVKPSDIATNINNGTNFSSRTVSINWTATDATSTVVNCSLVVDNVVNASNLQKLANTLVSQSVVGLSEAQHTWYVNCSDTLQWNTTGSLSPTMRAFFVDVTNPVPTLTLSSTAITLRASLTIGCASTDTRDPNPGEYITVKLPNGDYSADTDGTFTDTSVIGTYTARCTSTDDAGRTAYSESTFTVGDEITTNIGGGSGGGAASAASVSVSTTLSVSPETPAVVKVENAKIAVSEIILDVSEASSNVKITVAAISAPPSSTPAAEGKVFKYLDIKKENLEDAKLKSAKIKFAVDRTWLADNGVTPANVALKRFTSVWQDLPTKVITSDGDKFYFEAETPGFSVFAIGVKAAAAEELVAEEPVAEEPVAEEPVAEEPVAEPAVEETKSLAWLYVLITLVVIGAAVFFFVKKKKK